MAQSSLFEKKLTPSPQPKVYSVSALTSAIKGLLEDKFPFIWLYGEISNFAIPRSGHYYFVLKDETAQINAVMFRGQNRQLKFMPENGMTVTGMGRIAVYEPRGAYQIILEYLEPHGVGAIQLAFEQLKKQLAAEGLFDESHKKKIPSPPSKIGVITSPAGAAIQDIIHILGRRFPTIPIEIAPVSVQGDTAASEIVAAFDLFRRQADAESAPDVIILARGGGSLEDLAAFNHEAIARAIFACPIPVVSAIGHETDFTIADFTADLRAPTPSAAAELVAPVKAELKRRIAELNNQVCAAIQRHLRSRRDRLNQVSTRLKSPRARVQDTYMKLDDLNQRLARYMDNHVNRRRERLEGLIARLRLNHPGKQAKLLQGTLKQTNDRLIALTRNHLTNKRHRLQAAAARLNALSPLAVLERGYSITRAVTDKRIITDPDSVALNDQIDVRVARGNLTCRIERKKKNAQEKDL